MLVYMCVCVCVSLPHSLSPSCPSIRGCLILLSLTLSLSLSCPSIRGCLILPLYPRVCFTYADVYWRMLTYADVC